VPVPKCVLEGKTGLARPLVWQGAGQGGH